MTDSNATERDDAGAVRRDTGSEEVQRMSKDKRQLRAEAVERLRANAFTTDVAVMSMIGVGNDEFSAMTLGETAERLIDLLTDEEPPEGDAVGLLRSSAESSTPMTTLRCEIGCAYTASAFAALADMIERDYVRRDSSDCGTECYCCAKLDELEAKLAIMGGDKYHTLFGMTFDEIRELKAKLDELTAERYALYTALDLNTKSLIDENDSLHRKLAESQGAVYKLAELESLVRNMYSVVNAKNTWWDAFKEDTKSFAERMKALGIEVVDA